jgi:hypothetical protein
MPLFTGLHGYLCISAEFQRIGVFASWFGVSSASHPVTYIYRGKGNFFLNICINSHFYFV